MHTIPRKALTTLALLLLLGLGLVYLPTVPVRVPNPLLPPGQVGVGTAVDPLGMEWSEAWDVVLDMPRDY